MDEPVTVATGGPRLTGVEPGAVERCLATLRRAPAGLVTDIDGTISAIAPTPAEAVVEETAREALRRLAGRLALVAVISGRAAAVGAAMVGLPEITYVGNHGMERSLRGVPWAHPGAAAGAKSLGAALAEVAAGARASGHGDGVLVEDKGLSGTVHYRLAPDPEAARAALLPLAVAARGLDAALLALAGGGACLQRSRNRQCEIDNESRKDPRQGPILRSGDPRLPQR